MVDSSFIGYEDDDSMHSNELVIGIIKKHIELIEMTVPPEILVNSFFSLIYITCANLLEKVVDEEREFPKLLVSFLRELADNIETGEFMEEQEDEGDGFELEQIKH